MSSDSPHDPSPRCEYLLWPDPKSGPYDVRIWFGPVNGRPAVVGVEMWGVSPLLGQLWDVDHEHNPVPRSMPDAAITAAASRLPLGRLLDSFVADNRLTVQYGRQLGLGVEHLEWATPDPDEPLPRRAGRKRLSDGKLRAIADRYRAAVQSGDRRPAKAVEEYLNELGVKGVYGPTVRSWIRAARDRGFLTDGRR